MKKLSSFLTITTLICGLFVSSVVPINAAVEGQELDQAYEELSYKIGAATIYTYSDRIQTFKPTKNKIVSVDVYLKDRVPDDTLIMKLIDKETGIALITDSHTMTAPVSETWETFSFSAPYVSVTPGKTYGIKLNCSNNTTKWYYGSGGYEGGVFEVNESRDAFFRVYGVSVGSDESAPAEETQEESEEQEKQAQEAEVDASIEAPQLSFVEKNGEISEAPIEKIEVTSNDKLSAGGTAPQDTTVVLFIGDKTFSEEVDDEGTWVVDIKHSGLEEGEYTVEAQAQVDEEKGSEKAELFSLKKIATEKVAVAEERELSFWNNVIGPWYWYITAILLGLLLILVIILGLLQRKHLKEKKGEIPDLSIDSELPRIDKKAQAVKRTKGRVIDITKK